MRGPDDRRAGRTPGVDSRATGRRHRVWDEQQHELAHVDPIPALLPGKTTFYRRRAAGSRPLSAHCPAVPSPKLCRQGDFVLNCGGCAVSDWQAASSAASEGDDDVARSGTSVANSDREPQRPMAHYGHE